MPPAHRCRAEGCLRVVVHAYGCRNPWVQPGAAQISYIKDLLAARACAATATPSRTGDVTRPHRNTLTTSLEG